jgi:hypothetical protein
MEISEYNSIEYVLIHKPQFAMLDAIFTQQKILQRNRMLIFKKKVI